jgi:hypothetical protein
LNHHRFLGRCPSVADTIRLLAGCVHCTGGSPHFLAELCAGLEKAGKAEDWNAIDEAMPNLNPAFIDVMKFIKAL